MASKLLISLSIFAVVLSSKAQTADFYFHNGSKHYVFGEKEKAKNEIDTGLQKFPQDPQLNSLAGLIKKEEEEKKQSSNSENKDQEKDKDQKSESQQEQDSAQEDKEPQQKDSQQAKDEQNKQEQQKNQDGKEQKPEEIEAEQQEAAAIAAGQMTPEQARQFLDAQKQEDKALIFAPQKDPKLKTKSGQNRPLRDW